MRSTTSALVVVSLAALAAAIPTPAAAFSCVGHEGKTSHKAIGLGIPQIPYRLCTAAQLRSLGLAPNDWTRVYSLEADVDMSAYTSADVKPIGSAGRSFTGTFRGNDHAVTGFTYVAPAVTHAGLFGHVRGRVENLVVVDATIEGFQFAGALVAEVGAGAVLTNVHVTGAAVANHWSAGAAGGLAGQIAQATLSGATVSDSHVTGIVSIGGLVGIAGAAATIADAAAVAVQVYGTAYVGGLVGTASSATIVDSSATGEATAPAHSVGGLIGRCVASVVTGGLADVAVEGVDVLLEDERLGRFIGAKDCAVSDSHYAASATCVNLGGDGGCVDDMPGVTALP